MWKSRCGSSSNSPRLPNSPIAFANVAAGPLEVAVACARDFQRLSRRRTPVSFLLTGGGHDLPMVKALAADPGISWHYEEAKPNVAANAEELDFYNVYRQLAVAIGGAIQESAQGDCAGTNGTARRVAAPNITDGGRRRSVICHLSWIAPKGRPTASTPASSDNGITVSAATCLEDVA